MADFDNYRPDLVKKKTNPMIFYVFLTLFCAVSLPTLFYLAKSGAIPSYTIYVEDGQITIKRDQLGQAEVTPEPTSPLIVNLSTADEQAEPPQQVHDENDDQQQQQAQQSKPDGRVKKCLNAEGRVVYQTIPCEASGLRVVKTLTAEDGYQSTAHTYSYKDEQARQQQSEEQQRQSDQAARDYERREERQRQRQEAEIAQAQKQADCKNIEAYRENIRSQQRIRSTEDLREQYNYWTRLWHDRCLG